MQEFAWPPPVEELDAMEVVFLDGDTDADARIARLEPRELAGGADAAGGDVETQAAQSRQDQRQPQRPRTAIGVGVRVLPYLVAIVIGAMLGERQARLTRTQPAPSDRPERIARAAEPPSAAAPPTASPAIAAPATPSAAASSLSTRPQASRRTSASDSASTTPPRATAAAPVAANTTPAVVAPMPSHAEEAAALPAIAPALAPLAAPPASAATRIAPLGTVTSPDAMLDVAKPVSVSMAVVSDQAAIRRALQRYEDAYERLDARAAAAVWPSLDVSALSRAFEGLKAQHLEFERCDLNVSSRSATAVCSGSTSIVRRVGNADPITAAQLWVFRLKRLEPSADWTIESVSTKR
jgi:hypothetical protein